MKFTIFKTICLGIPRLRTADNFRDSLDANEFNIDEGTDDILGKPQFTIAAKEVRLDLVVVSVAELGFEDRGAPREQIYTRIRELGLKLCPAEAGPQLRLQYPDQPRHEWLVIAMEPIIDSCGAFRLFSVERRGLEFWLLSYCDGSGGIWSSGCRFVCRK